MINRWTIPIFLLQVYCANAFSFSRTPLVHRQPLRMITEEEDTPIQSVALDWAKKLEEQGVEPRKKFLIIGGGWGGWGAAKALCESGVGFDITLLDALPDPAGVSL